MGTNHLQTDTAVFCAEPVEAFHFQNGQDVLAHLRFVFDHKDFGHDDWVYGRFMNRAVSAPTFTGSPKSGRVTMNWVPAPSVLWHLILAMKLDATLHDGQAETRAGNVA